MYNIAIIGAGQLGSRHLQGIKTADLSISIEVVDSNIEALKIAEDRYNEIIGNQDFKKVNFLSSIEELNDNLDLVIISTSSAPRLSITRNLIETKNIKHIIFEKVLFQNEESFFLVNNLLKSKNIKAWVNCPRRMYDYYNEIKSELHNEDKLIVTVFGGNWGLGCNSIHFIDIFSYLSRQQSYTLFTDGLNKKLYPSKRSGYIEFCGILSATTERGDILNLISQDDSNTTPLISIVSQDKKYVIDESNGYVISFRDNKWESRNIKVPYQSQLTGRVIENVLVNKNVKLTTYEESTKLHLPFISSLLNFYNSITGYDTMNCPIT